MSRWAEEMFSSHLNGFVRCNYLLSISHLQKQMNNSVAVCKMFTFLTSKCLHCKSICKCRRSPVANVAWNGRHQILRTQNDLRDVSQASMKSVNLANWNINLEKPWKMRRSLCRPELPTSSNLSHSAGFAQRGDLLIRPVNPISTKKNSVWLKDREGNYEFA